MAATSIVVGCGDDGAAISGGTIEHWDGTRWTVSLHTGGKNSRYFSDVWGSGRDDVWAVGLGEILRWDGSSWTTLMQREDEQAFGAVWGTGPRDVWVAGTELLHWDGSTWATLPLPDGGTRIVRGLSLQPDDIWATVIFEGSTWPWPATGVVHWDGTTWRIVWRADPTARLGQQVYALWGSGAEDVWAVGQQADGDHSLVIRWDGTRSSETLLRGDRFIDVWGTDRNDVWAVESALGLMHWDGLTWSLPAGGGETSGQTILRIWGLDAHAAWRVGDFAGCDFWDGRSWSRLPARWSPRVGTAVWASGRGDVWVVGGTES